jgi:hypothetical protein
LTEPFNVAPLEVVLVAARVITVGGGGVGVGVGAAVVTVKSAPLAVPPELVALIRK